MKKFVITAIMIAGSLSFVNAQIKHKIAAHKATPSATVATSPNATTSTSTTAQVAKADKKKAHSHLHKKTGSVTAASANVKKDAASEKSMKQNKTVAKSSATPVKKNNKK
ncbi:MAG TPA: hypothetical protein VGW31_06205 [Hanamia sp.]|nr:hypothetical protein [Hanamia sp.]